MSQIAYKDFDDVVMGCNRDNFFPVAQSYEVNLPYFIKQPITLIFIKIALGLFFILVWGSSLVGIPFTSYQFSDAINLAFVTVTFCLVILQFYTLKNRAYISIFENKIILKTSYFQRYVLDFDHIYEIYMTMRYNRNGGVDSLLNIHYLTQLGNYNSRQRLVTEVKEDELTARKHIAIARTVMMNYHNRHQITNLPIVKFIQQK